MARQPVGLQLTRTARVLAQEFDRAMADEGGSAPVWQVLLLIRSKQWGQQSEMAKAMGVTGATLTHHLNALERDGLVRRWREDANRRVQRVELTDEGVATFDRLRKVAVKHDARVRAALGPERRDALAGALDALAATFSA